MKTQLLTSLHHKTNHTMSDGEWYDGYNKHHDNDDDDHVYDCEHFEELKKEERGILHTERKVDVQVRHWGGTDLTRKLYDRGTVQLKVRILVEDEDDSNEEETLDKDRGIENYHYCLTVLTRDMKQIKEEFEKDIEVWRRCQTFVQM